MTDTGSGPFPLNFIAVYGYTVWLWLGLSPPRLREEEGFALNASTTYRLRYSEENNVGQQQIINMRFSIMVVTIAVLLIICEMYFAYIG